MVFRSLGFVSLLVFLATTTFAETIIVDVSITLIDTKRSSITVSYDGKSRQLELAKNLQVEIDGKKSEIRSLKADDSALVEYDKERQVVTRIIVRTELMQPAAMIAEGWDEIDQRLIFLMVRLANLEASLEAIEQRFDSRNRQVNSKSSAAKRADRANEDMDRMGGGPVKWSQFYGMTAEKFFYHPTDRNSTYHTVTVLNQQGSQADNKVGGGVPSSQGLPVHQRPPQFDYIYRANEKARTRADAEAAELKGKLDQLVARRHRLEAEQAGLWVEIAFRAIAHYDLDKKPMYRFEPLMLASDTTSRQRTEVARASAVFMAIALSIIAEAEKDQSGTFIRLKPTISKARQSLSDTFLKLAVDVTEKQSTVGRMYALAKKLDDIAANLTDSYLVAIEGDSAKDQQRKDTFRGQLQQSLLAYAQIILAMDEMSSQMKYEYGYHPDIEKPIKLVGSFTPNNATSRDPIIPKQNPTKPMNDNQVPIEKPTPVIANETKLFKGHSYKVIHEDVSWTEAKTRCELIGGHLATISGQDEDDFVLEISRDAMQSRGKLDGVWLGATDEKKEGRWRWVDETPITYTDWGLLQPDNERGSQHYLVMSLKNGDWHDEANNGGEFRTFFVCEWDDPTKVR